MSAMSGTSTPTSCWRSGWTCARTCAPTWCWWQRQLPPTRPRSPAPSPVDVIWPPPALPLPLLPGSRVDPRLLAHVADVTRRALAEGDGDVLAFVPGEREIATVSRLLHGVDADVRPLFGRQSSAEQDA